MHYSFLGGIPMSKNATIIFRIDADTKDRFQSIVNLEGREISDVLLASIKKINEEGCIPKELCPYLKHRSYKDLSIPDIRKRLLQVIDSRYKEKIIRAYLFGSFARGEETEESDIDIHIEPGGDCSIKDLALFRRDLEAAFKRPVDVFTGGNSDPEFMASVQKDEICLYDSSKAL